MPAASAVLTPWCGSWSRAGTVAADAGLGFLALQEEQYDFVVPKSRLERPVVQAFRALLSRTDVRSELARRGFR